MTERWEGVFAFQVCLIGCWKETGKGSSSPRNPVLLMSVSPPRRLGGGSDLGNEGNVVPYTGIIRTAHFQIPLQTTFLLSYLSNVGVG